MRGDVEPRRPRLRFEAGGLVLLAIALAFNIYFLRGEARVSAVPLNDEVFHSVASQRLAEAVAGGEPFLDPWVPNWGSRVPGLEKLPTAPSSRGGPVVSAAPPGGDTAAFALLATIVTGLLPLALYAGARIFGLSAAASGLASLLCLLPCGAGDFGRYGLSYGASVWLGSGLYHAAVRASSAAARSRARAPRSRYRPMALRGRRRARADRSLAHRIRLRRRSRRRPPGPRRVPGGPGRAHRAPRLDCR